MARQENGTQTTESHDEEEDERRSPLWAGLVFSGGASGRRGGRRGLMVVVCGRCCEGTARERPRCREEERRRAGWREMAVESQGGRAADDVAL